MPSRSSEPKDKWSREQFHPRTVISDQDKEAITAFYRAEMAKGRTSQDVVDELSQKYERSTRQIQRYISEIGRNHTIPLEQVEGYLCTTKDTLHGKDALRWSTDRPQQTGDEFTLNLGRELPIKALRFLQGRQRQWDRPKRWQVTFSSNRQIIEEVEGEGFIEVERMEPTPIQWIGVVVLEPRLPTDRPPSSCWAVDNIELE
jgi:hypothetical protein